MAFYTVDERGVVTMLGSGDATRKESDGLVVLVIPGSDVQVRRAQIPARTDAQARAAAPYFFEGSIAEHEEAMHYAIAPAQNDAGDRLVVAVAEARLKAWIAACAQIGREPQAIHVDCALWPAPARTVDIVETDGRVIVSGGMWGGYSIETGVAPVLMRQWLAQIGAPVDVVCLDVRDRAPWRDALATAPKVQARDGEDAHQVLARAAANPPAYAPDLRQGAFSLAPEAPPPWQVWRVAIAFMLLAYCLQIGNLLLAGYRDQRLAQEVTASATASFRATRPDTQRIVNLRAQVTAAKNALARAGAHPVLRVTDPLVATLRAHPLVRLDEVRYAGEGRNVSLFVSAADSGALNAMSSALKEHSVRVNVQGLQPVAGRYAAQLIVEAP